MGLTAYTDSLARDDLVERLDQSSRQAPRLLYRGWSDASCSGIPGLNTPERITPLALLKDPSRPVQHLGKHPQARDLIHNHGYGSTKLLTEFSSWTDSWILAWNLAARGSPGSAHISILDRERLGRPVNFYHLDDLYELGLARSASYEWLAHGVVEGEGLQTRALHEMWGTTEDGNLQLLELHRNLPAPLLSEAPLQILGLECTVRRNDIERMTVLMQKVYFSGPTSGQYQVLLTAPSSKKLAELCNLPYADSIDAEKSWERTDKQHWKAQYSVTINKDLIDQRVTLPKDT